MNGPLNMLISTGKIFKVTHAESIVAAHGP